MVRMPPELGSSNLTGDQTCIQISLFLMGHVMQNHHCKHTASLIEHLSSPRLLDSLETKMSAVQTCYDAFVEARTALGDVERTQASPGAISLSRITARGFSKHINNPIYIYILVMVQ